jgi:hypothetical protein
MPKDCTITMTDIVDDFHIYQSGNKNFPDENWNPKQACQIIADKDGEFYCGFFPARLTMETLDAAMLLIFGPSIVEEYKLTPITVSITDNAWPIIRNEIEAMDRIGRFDSPQAIAALE